LSHRATTWAWAISKSVPNANALLVLLKLADMAHDNGKAWPSHGYLSGELPISSRSIWSAMKYLDDAGLIRREPRPGKSDMIWLALSAVTIYADGPEEDDHFEGGKPRGRPQKTSANPLPTPNKTSAAGANEPLSNLPVTIGVLSARDPFDDWWAIYPLKKAKKDARSAWGKIHKALATMDPPQGLDFLMERTQAYADHVVGFEDRHIAHPATWLNGERWNDELKPHRSQTDGRLPTAGADFATARAFARTDAMESGARQASAARRSRWWNG
jgi:hypothetical protein